jgi:hypothetical protein
MKGNKMKKSNGKWPSGVWIKRIAGHENSEENGYLTYGRSYQVMSAEKHYSQSKNFINRAGNDFEEPANKVLAPDCVMIKDDTGKIGLFGAKNFKLTSKVG